MKADLDNHRITGLTTHGDLELSVPLVSHIEGNLWTGGCVHGVKLDDDFRYVFSLYPWERYELGPDTTRVEWPMRDSVHEQMGDLDARASEVVEAIRAGKTLVHCQAGLNRSGIVAARALVLMGRSPRDAVDLLRAKRCAAVLCNPAFEAHILAL